MLDDSLVRRYRNDVGLYRLVQTILQAIMVGAVDLQDARDATEIVAAQLEHLRADRGIVPVKKGWAEVERKILEDEARLVQLIPALRPSETARRAAGDEVKP